MAKPSTKGLLKEILSGDIEWVYVHITEKAVEWAIAGFVEEANHLLEQLWKFNIPHSGHLWLSDEGFQVLWSLSDKTPSGIPFQFKNIDEIEKENWSRIFYPCGGDLDEIERILNIPLNQLNNNELLGRPINAGFYNSDKPTDILDTLKRFLETENAVGSTYFHATCAGALVAAKNNLASEAEYFIKLWGKGYLKYWMNYLLAYLMRDRKTADYLLKGILAEIFKITSSLCKKETDEILNALSSRISKGRSLVYGSLSWAQLLDKISKLSIEQKTIKFSKEITERQSLNKPAATKSEIAKTEKRLNTKLPNDYREFLLTSNGFECFSYTGVTLASIDEVDFLKNVYEELIDIWTNSMEDIDPSFGNKLKSSIIIGGHQEEQQLLLIPLPNNKWECWHFSAWRPGEQIYQSFRFYMEDELQELEDGFHTD